MISTKLIGKHIEMLQQRIEQGGINCLDRIDSMTLCRMLFSIGSDRYGESSVVDISSGLLDSCLDRSHELGAILTNRYKLGAVWKFTTDFGLEVLLSKIPRQDGKNVIRITLMYPNKCLDDNGEVYEANVVRPLIEYNSQEIRMYKVADKKNHVKGLYDKELFHPTPQEEAPVEEEKEPEPVEVAEEQLAEKEPVPEAELSPEPEAPAAEEVDQEPDEEEGDDDDNADTESQSETAPESEKEESNDQPEPDTADPDESGSEGESAEPEEGDAGSEPDGGTDGDDTPGVEEAPAEEQEQPKEEPEVNKGSRTVWIEVLPEYADSQLDVSPYVEESKSELCDKITDDISQTTLTINEDNIEVSKRSEIVFNKLIESPLAKGKLLDRDYEIGGVKYDFDKGYTVEIRIKEPERELQTQMQSDKGDEPVKTDFVDITDPEVRNGTLLAMFGTTAPSANHVHTFLNEFHTAQKTKSFLETKVDGQGTYPTESDVFYDNIVWAFVKMKDGKFWRIAIARRDFSLPDESWIESHHIPGRWVTLIDVQDGPSHIGGYRRRQW